MCYDEFEINSSPFHKIDGFKKSSERVSVRTDIAPEDYELVEKYIKQRDPTFDPKKKNNNFDNSKFVRELLMDFLNNTAFDKSSFEDLYIILLLSKSQVSGEAIIDGEVIGAIEGKDIFYRENHFNYYKGNRNKFNFIYYLEEFNERQYNELFYSLRSKGRLFYHVDESIHDDFVKVKMRLTDVYPEIDIDNAYFTIVNVNNYLDGLYEGQYLYKGRRFQHMGVIALISPFDEFRICMTCLWSHYPDGFFQVSFEYKDIGEFNERTIYLTNNDDIVKEYYSITTTMTRESALEFQIDDLDKTIQALTLMKQEKQNMLDEIQKNK